VKALLPGTLPYATSSVIENRVSARMARQALLDREDPPRLWAIMDEAAVRRQVGGREIMRGQLAWLREAAARPNVTIQVIPFDAGSHPGMDGAFIVLDFADPADQSIVYADSSGGGLFLEEEVELRRYILMFEHLRAAALRPDETLTSLAEIAAQT